MIFHWQEVPVTCLCFYVAIVNNYSNHMTVLCVLIKFDISIVTVLGLLHYKCVVPSVTNIFQSGRFWARSTASVHDSLCNIIISALHADVSVNFVHDLCHASAVFSSLLFVFFIVQYFLVILLSLLVMCYFCPFFKRCCFMCAHGA